ncbi:uncharacterized protein LOC123682217 [Harmonia axyridis]|uniref:uncharacterized protein LOC123682217 n=1 Tax=Harmonia axyridis TaxID=115357 RepID=UPI001E276007|nr:uncharacterized protein LOC123682217 [Harmonia axyridis]
MINIKILLLVVLGVLLSSVATAPSEYATCYDKVCPASTTSCSKQRLTTDDNKYLDIIVICWHIKDEVQRHTDRILNPFGGPFADGQMSASFHIAKGGKLVPKLVSETENN